MGLIHRLILKYLQGFYEDCGIPQFKNPATNSYAFQQHTDGCHVHFLKNLLTFFLKKVMVNEAQL